MTTRTKLEYEAELLAEFQGLSEVEQAKMLRLIRFFKEELLLSPDEDKQGVLCHAGLLTDLSPEQEERFAKAVRRRSLFGRRRVRL